MSIRPSTDFERRRVLLERLLDTSAGSAARAGAARIEPIPRRRPGVLPPLSFSQERFWFLSRLAPDSPLHVESIATSLPHGALDPNVLERALNVVVARHEVLRTCFRDAPSGPVQHVMPELWVPLRAIELQDVDGDRRDAEVARVLREHLALPFDLGTAPLLRPLLIRSLPEDVFALAIHHIVSDGWSMQVMSREINAVAAAIACGREPDLPPLPIQYGDYALWQRHAAERDGGEGLAYWRAQLASVPTLALPLDFPRPRALSYAGAAIDVRIPANVSAGVRALAAREHATVFMTTLAAFAAVLARLAGQSDLAIGTPVAGRSRAELEPLIGLFLNTVVLRIDLSGNPSFRTLLARVRKTAVAAFDHQDVSFERVVDSLGVERDLARNPVFQVLFQLFTPQEPRGRSARGAESIALEKSAANLDLSLHLWDDGKIISGRFEHSTELLRGATVRRWFDYFVRFLTAAINHPNRPLSRLDMLSDAARAELCGPFGCETGPSPQQSLAAGFAERVAAAPEAVALIDDTAQITYAALDERARQIAQRLAALGVTPGDRVVICLARSFDAVAAMLGTMRIGAAYVPIDPSYPTERIRFVIADSRAKAVVTVTAHRAYAGRRKRLLLDALPRDTNGRGDVSAPPEALDVAYIIYTSGSTGRPKGVMGTHEATLNRLNWMWRALPFAPGEVACHKTSLAFVDSVSEIFGPLLAGIPAVIFGEHAALDPRALGAALGRHKVTRLLVVPSQLRALLDARVDLAHSAPELALLLTSGERLTADLVERLHCAAPSIRLVNLYGSSEVAGDITCADDVGAAQGREPPIGRPLDNCRLYVLDAHMRPVVPGATGELYAGGPQLARGYFGRPALTAERFVPDPFSERPGQRLFATGDRVRRTHDDELLFEGRTDHQVKIRGHRVELGEIEAALRAVEGVGEAVVTFTADAAGGRLDAWVTRARDDARLDSGGLLGFAAQRLPRFMVPASATVLDGLPRTPNGKIDAAALTMSAAPRRPDRAAVAPRTSTERAIAEIWRELLARDVIGIDDHFFDSGGHSLLATRLVTIIRERFDLDLPLTTVFLSPTLRELAEEVERQLVAEIESLGDDELRAALDGTADHGGIRHGD